MDASHAADSSAAASTQPAALAGRIEALDVLRGVAVFGILIENVFFFLGPRVQWELVPPLWPGTLDRVVVGLLRWLEEGKLYAIYALLFGLGLAMQHARSGASRAFIPLALRRMLALLAIGLVHGLLIWWGDILTVYAVLGLLLLMFLRCRPWELVGIAVAAWLLPVAFFLFVGLSVQFIPPDQQAEWAAQAQAKQVEQHAEAARAQAAYAQGGWSEIAAQQRYDFGRALQEKAVGASSIMMMFLLGVWAARRRMAERDALADPLWRRLWYWCLPAGLLLHAGYAYLVSSDSPAPPTGEIAARGVLGCLGQPLLALGYVAAVFRAAQSTIGRRWLAPLRAVGEMSLTNYLTHSVLGMLLAYRFGLGQYGRVSPAFCILIAVAIFVIQIPLSNWWLRRFRFGPVEWLWRTATYARPQPWLRTSVVSARD